MSQYHMAEVDYHGHDAEVEYTFDPGEPEVHTESNGDPGTPGIGPSIEITRIWVELESIGGRKVMVDVSSIFYETSIEQDIIEYHEEILRNNHG